MIRPAITRGNTSGEGEDGSIHIKSSIFVLNISCSFIKPTATSCYLLEHTQIAIWFDFYSQYSGSDIILIAKVLTS